MKEANSFKFAASGRDRESGHGVWIVQATDRNAERLTGSEPSRGRGVGASPDGELLFVGTTIPADEGQPDGAVQAIRRVPESEDLESLNVVGTGGSSITSIVVHPRFPLLVCANFRRFGGFSGPGSGSRGSLSVHPIFIAGDLVFGPAPDEAGLGCWRLQEDGHLNYLYHRPELPIPSGYASLPNP